MYSLGTNADNKQYIIVVDNEPGGMDMQITIREPGSAITHFIGMMLAV